MITTKYMRSLVLLCMSVAFGMAYADSYYRDVTAKYMKDSAFLPGWQGGLSNVQDSVGECFDGAFNLYQVLYDMPPGDYELTANAFYRCGTNGFSKENMTDGRNHYAYLYLGETRVPVTGLFDDGRTDAPNSTFAANQAFKAGEFLNTVTHYHPGGDLVLGIRNLGGYSEEWCAFSNFKLKRGSEDYTTLIVNAGFTEGIDIHSEAWNFLNSDYSIKRPDFNHGGGVFRKTNASPYNFGQQVELPAGTYRFSALTFMRYGGAGNYDGQIITCKGGWELIDSNPYPSPKQWYDGNLYSETDYTANAYLYVSFENDKPTSLETAVELLEENVKLTRVKGPWEICKGDYPVMPENETRGTAEGTQIIPSYDTRNVVAEWVDSGSERESAAAFINEPDKWRQYVEFTLTEPSKVWVGLGKDQNSPRQYWNPCTDFKLEQLTDDSPISGGVDAGDEFEYEGIKYTVIDPVALTCQTKAGHEETPNIFGGNYVTSEGELSIPATVSNGSQDFTVTAIGEYGFSGSFMTSVSLPTTVTTVGSYAFYGCGNLTSMTLPESLTAIGNVAFAGSSSLTTIIYKAALPIRIQDYSIFDSSIYETATLYMPNALLADIEVTVPWSNFKRIVAKDGVIPPDVAAGDEFEYEGIKYTVIDPVALTCETKAGWTEPAPDGGNYTIPGNHISYELGVTNLVIPETVSNGNLDFTVVAVGDYGFCSGRFTSITLPSTLTHIGEWAFRGSGLTSLEWPESIPYLSNSVLRECTDLKSLVLPENLDSIGRAAISFCLSLDSITLPAQVRTVGDIAFDHCFSLKNVTINNSQTKLGIQSFRKCTNLVTLTLSSLFDISHNPFENCSSIASIVWKNRDNFPAELYSYFGNPNLLVYADHPLYSLSQNDKNIVVREDGLNWVAYNLTFTQGYPFYPKYGFTVSGSTQITIDFNQTTPIGGCAGWQTIVLPFDVSLILNNNNDDLTPFGAVEDLNYQRPFWLYRADSLNGWREATRIQSGIPYIISMPNNEAYDTKYNVSGPVTFVSGEGITIEPEVTNTYAVDWINGTQFRSLWLPLDEVEAEKAMGLNVGIDDLRNDDGELLLPGSAFHRDVLPRPLEAYVRSDGSRMAMPVIGGQSHVALMKADNGLSIHAENGSIFLKSDCDRTVEIYRIDGVRAATVRLTSGVPAQVDGLAKGLYIIGGHKVIMK